jgi:hypothetical protein
MAYIKVSFTVRPERLMKVMRNLYHGRDSKPVPPEYKFKALPLHELGQCLGSNVRKALNRKEHK